MSLSAFQMNTRRIERDSGRVRHVERLDLTRHIEPRQCIHGLARLLAQPLALGAKHERDLVAGEGTFKRCRAFRIKSDSDEAELVQFAERIGEIGDLDIRDEFQRAGGGFGEHARSRSGCGAAW